VSVPPSASLPTDAGPRARARDDHHRLYVPSRVIGAVLMATLAAFQRWDGEDVPVPLSTLLALFFAWPVVMYALHVPFPSNRAADWLQLLDGVAMGALLGATRTQAYLLFFVGYIFSATAIGGAAAGAAATVLASGTCVIVLLATGASLELHATLSHADIAALVGFAVYALFIAALGFVTRGKLVRTRRALDALSRDLESRVEERTQAVASANAAISRFVPREFLQALGHDDVTSARLGQATAREVTVLFADIRDFTSLSERMSPEETFRFLNGCLSRLGPHIRAQSGFVDKYIGDAIMALFPNGPADAVRAALAMQRELRGASVGNAPVTIGVGIHVGRVIMGTIGEEQRFEATVISDAVNLTARLESLTKQLGCAMLVSGEVFARLSGEDRSDVRSLGTFVVKGRSQAVSVFELFGADPERTREVKRAHAKPLADALALHAEGRAREALAIVAPLAEARPDDPPLAWWTERIRREADELVPPSGRGVVTLEEK
jgi:class 3 adenylate cyclase